jgi:beta-galactosidase
MKIANEILYGGDYNPEQWPREIWDRDIELMKKAGVNCVSLGIFSWALIQPAEDRWDFEWLDDIIERLHRGGIRIDLATATASQPPWISSKYPEVLPVDEYGRRVNYGSRQSYCPNNPQLRSLSAKLVRRMAERYGGHPSLILWHVNNEYACHTDACYCDRCRDEFREWLRDRYGSIVALNDAWGTRFWSQHYGDFSEIPAPRVSSAQRNPAHMLDYRRFMSDSLLGCYLNERNILKELTPGIPVTTNFMMRFKPLDYFSWAPHVDVISWDSYPDPDADYDPAHNALDHDLMRGIGGGAPFILMEQASSQVNWREVNQVKPPGMMERYSYQALAHGADAILFFQWRQSLRGAEKWHSAMVDHSGREDSRTFTEVSRLGRTLSGFSDICGSRSVARAALIFDYESWWSCEYEPGPSSRLNYLDTVDRVYRAFRDIHVPLDIVSVNSDFRIMTWLRPHCCIWRRRDWRAGSGGTANAAAIFHWPGGPAWSTSMTGCTPAATPVRFWTCRECILPNSVPCLTVPA